MWQERISEFVTLFVVINPLGAVPVFLALAGDCGTTARRKMAVKAVVVAFVVLAFFACAGSFLLRHMNITLNAFQIAGGIVLFLFALSLVRGDFEAGAPDKSADPMTLAIYPLAMPKIAGPGAMLAIVLLIDDDRDNFSEQAMTIGVLVSVLLVQLGILWANEPISRLIGRAGAAVIGRVMGMIIAALAVNIILTALVAWLGLPKL